MSNLFGNKLCPVLEQQIKEYAITYELLPWIDINKFNWYWLSYNPNAIHLLEKNIREANGDKIDWRMLSQNPNAIPLLEANKDKIDWWYLSQNPSIFQASYASQTFKI